LILIAKKECCFHGTPAQRIMCVKECVESYKSPWK